MVSGIILLSLAAISSMPRHPIRRLFGAVHLVLLILITGGTIHWISVLFNNENDWRFSSGVGKIIRDRSGQALPSFEAPMLDGSMISSDMLYGKVALLDFWATWCAPCVSSLPHIQKLHEGFSGEQFVAIGMNVGEQRARVERFMNDNAYTFPVAFVHQDMKNRFYIKGIPTILIVDRRSMIRYFQIGFNSKRVDSIRTIIRSLLQEP
jgi:thiol-disulfide isomerase/thioredoxin